MMIIHQWNSSTKNSRYSRNQFQLKQTYENVYSTKLIWKFCPGNVDHFVHTIVYLFRTLLKFERVSNYCYLYMGILSRSDYLPGRTLTAASTAIDSWQLHVLQQNPRGRHDIETHPHHWPLVTCFHQPSVDFPVTGTLRLPLLLSRTNLRMVYILDFFICIAIRKSGYCCLWNLAEQPIYKNISEKNPMIEK